MTARMLICACEDVTDHDVQEAIQAGHTDMESLKRFTGLATGICQGKSCLAAAAGLLARHNPTVLQPTTQRAPLYPTRLGVLAAGGALPALYPGPAAPALTAPQGLPTVAAELAPLPKQAAVVIIGGGIMGLATAYHLARLGERRVVVLERGYLNAGASGRNGGGVRSQWSTELNILLMQDSMRQCRKMAHELGINVWLRQGGYLFLARKAGHMQALTRHVALQNRLGVQSRLVTPAGCLKIVPELETHDVLGGAFHAGDGVIFPWPFLWGYAAHAQARGVHLATFTPATGIDVQAGKVCGVRTARGTIQCDLVINAAAAWAGQVAAWVGVDLPNRPERHEILVTESLKPYLNPLVSEMESGLYFSQSMRGEIVAGLGDPEQPAALEMRSSLRFITRIARALCQRMPRLAQTQVVRQWAGCYDRTPDGNPVLGEVSEVGGFFQLHGFVGHGFMMAPAVSRRVAELLMKGVSDPIFTAYRPQRFAAGDTLNEETMIIG